MKSFEEMLEYQQKFQAGELERLSLDPERDRNALHHSICSHMIAECQELMDCVPWFLHKKPMGATRKTTIYEMVDVYKWLLNAMILHGVKPEEFYETFYRKSMVVENRVHSEVFVRSSPGPVLVCDIDGVLCDRDSGLLAFARGRLGDRGASIGKGASIASIPMLKSIVRQKGYEKIKREFYSEGAFFACQPMRESIAELLKAKELRVPVVLLTARPVRLHADLHALTIEWLYKHRVHFDALLCYEEKDKALAGWIHPESISLDDEPEQVARMANCCIAERFTTASQIGAAIERVQKNRRRLDAPE